MFTKNLQGVIGQRNVYLQNISQSVSAARVKKTLSDLVQHEIGKHNHFCWLTSEKPKPEEAGTFFLRVLSTLPPPPPPAPSPPKRMNLFSNAVTSCGNRRRRQRRRRRSDLNSTDCYEWARGMNPCGALWAARGGQTQSTVNGRDEHSSKTPPPPREKSGFL
jgi:hypothetical protein